jgi:hypothetical protein
MRPVHRIELNPELILRESSLGGPRVPFAGMLQESL